MGYNINDLNDFVYKVRRLCAWVVCIYERKRFHNHFERQAYKVACQLLKELDDE